MKVTTTRVDTSSREAMYAWAEQTTRDHGKVNLIFNNAGVALSSTIEGMDDDELAGIMAHEAAHVMRQHVARSYALQYQVLVIDGSIPGHPGPADHEGGVAAVVIELGFREGQRHAVIG